VATSFNIVFKAGSICFANTWNSLQSFSNLSFSIKSYFVKSISSSVFSLSTISAVVIFGRAFKDFSTSDEGLAKH
jgi:hypothetical protein